MAGTHPQMPEVPPARMDRRARIIAVLLVGWAVIWFVGMARHGGMAWHFFAQGARALGHAGEPGGGLHLYAAAPSFNDPNRSGNANSAPTSSS